MGKLKLSEAEKPIASSMPKPSGKCHVMECGKDAFIAIARCTIKDSRPISGTITRSGSFSRRMPGGEWKETTDFTFISWVERCQDCWMREHVKMM